MLIHFLLCEKLNKTKTKIHKQLKELHCLNFDKFPYPTIWSNYLWNFCRENQDCFYQWKYQYTPIYTYLIQSSCCALICSFLSQFVMLTQFDISCDPIFSIYPNLLQTLPLLLVGALICDKMLENVFQWTSL